ncbi:restriction endonuclease subunit S [Sorangium sp. So ce260]|uniref:restriction endonuclease subunit S n=1 Tax=Sorangium sp. So ce260 TaxID=3133291 RepID=UPI003F6438CA
MARVKWPRAVISDVCETIIDCVNKTAPTVDEVTLYKMIRTTNVRSGWVNLDEVKYVTEDVYKTWTRRQVPRRGDVILTREAPLGEVGMLRTDEPVFLGQRLVSYRADVKKLDNRFLLYAFQEDDLQGQIKALGSGATVEHMRVPDAEKLTLRLPPLFVQRRIADILSAYDELIENNTKRIKILEEMAHSLYREWFVNFRFPGHQKVKLVDSPRGKVPERWRLGTLEEIVSLQRGFDITKAQQREGPYPVISSSGPGSKHDEYKIEGPGVIIGRKGTLGTVFFNEGPCWPHDTTLWVTDFHGHGPWFCFYMLKELRLAQYDCGASNPTINRNHIHKIDVIVPPAYLTQEYDKLAGQLMRLARVLRESSGNLRRTRDLVLPRLISGEFDVSRLEALGA